MEIQAKHAISIECSHLYHPCEFPWYWPLARLYQPSARDLSGL